MTRVLIDWGGRGTVVTARARLDVEAGRIHLPDAIPWPVDGPTVIDLDPTDPGEAWRLRFYPEARTPFTWWVTVPHDDGDLVPVPDLPRLDPTTLTPDAHPPQPAWAAQLTQERNERTAALNDVRAALAAVVVPGDVVTADELAAALEGLQAVGPGPSHIAVTEDGRLAHRAGGTTTLTTTTSGRLAVVRA